MRITENKIVCHVVFCGVFQKFKWIFRRMRKRTLWSTSMVVISNTGNPLIRVCTDIDSLDIILRLHVAEFSLKTLMLDTGGLRQSQIADHSGPCTILFVICLCSSTIRKTSLKSHSPWTMLTAIQPGQPLFLHQRTLSVVATSQHHLLEQKRNGD